MATFSRNLFKHSDGVMWLQRLSAATIEEDTQAAKEEEMNVPLVRTPKNMDELTAMLPDMRGSQADLARVAIMAQAIGYNEGWDARENILQMLELTKEDT